MKECGRCKYYSEFKSNLKDFPPQGDCRRFPPCVTYPEGGLYNSGYTQYPVRPEGGNVCAEFNDGDEHNGFMVRVFPEVNLMNGGR